MLGDDWSASPSKDVVNALKEHSGKAIERVRRRQHITQNQLARDVNMSVRWLRELESGNPLSTLDDHLLCSQRLDIPLGPILFPLLYLSRGKPYPFLVAGFDTVELEKRLVDLIAERNSLLLREPAELQRRPKPGAA